MTTVPPPQEPAGGAAPPLRARGVSVCLQHREVLRGIDAAFVTGWTAVVGPNGAGKSTLLRALAGLQPLSAGAVTLGDADVHRMPPSRRARALAWLPQAAEASGELNVRETVELGRIARTGLLGPASSEGAASVERAMRLAGCSGWDERALQALSGGERQRVLLARVLATDAGVLLLDEPTTHLDPPHQVALARLFRRLALCQTVVTVLHDLPVALHADRLVVLADGRLQAAGPARDPAVLDALQQVFGGALRLHAGAGGVPWAQLAIDGPDGG